MENKMTDKIIGIPEGREGIWLIDPEQAIAIVKSVNGEEIHNYFNSANLPMALGANWGVDEVLDLVRRPDVRIALMFAPDDDINHHQLVVLTETKRYSFDVGEIAESRMVQPEAASKE